MTTAEYVAHLVSQRKPLTDEQIEQAARILASVEPLAAAA
ncbi:MAG: hypothetical protein JWO15_3863 [Sphingomonadales bacterium]|nr:hypothetical protein [Sphingomonadales bacterium]